MTIGFGNEGIEARRIPNDIRANQRPQRREASRVLDRQIQIELDVAAGIQSAGVNESDGRSVEQRLYPRLIGVEARPVDSDGSPHPSGGR